ncbi:TniQ family protein [Bacillus fungorum]|uniref:TniQ family protein n=1 Tax=Bacillus fungorum TaxID=2039284 RepID=UPI003F5648BD
MSNIDNSRVKVINELCWKGCLIERSKLYSLVPFNIGTPYVENISSYIVRLSNAHSVTVAQLVQKEISSLFTKKLRERAYNVFEYNKKIMGGSEFSLSTMDALVQLTTVNDIKYTTINPVHNILNTLNLFRDYQAWCPHCYSENIEEKDCVYNQLIWSFKDVTICPKHQIKLREVCQECNKSNPFLKRKYYLGVCQYCGSKLSEQQVFDEDINEWERWVAYVIGDLLANMLHIQETSLENIYYITMRILNEVFMGNHKRMRECLGVSKTSITRLKNKISFPPFSLLLKMSYITKQTLVELLCRQNIPLRKVEFNEKLIATNKKRKLDRHYIQESLQIVIQTKRKVSLTQICKELHISYPTLTNNFNEYCEKIRINNNALIKKEAEKKLQEKKRLLRSTIEKMHFEEQKYPSMRAVGKRLGFKIVTFKSTNEIYLEWVKILKDLSISYHRNQHE